jgi:large subunit ribosomal protein L24
MPKLPFRRNDNVQVIAGKDKGKSGKVLRVYPGTDRAVVEKLNQIYEHVKPNPQKGIQGGIVQKEGPIHVSNLQLICPSCNQPARVGHVVLSDGRRVRVCKKCNANID